MFSNAPFRETFGEIRSDESATEVLGDHVVYGEDHELLPPEETPKARIVRGESFDIRFFTEKQNGGWRCFDARARSFKGESVSGGVIVIREITE